MEELKAKWLKSLRRDTYVIIIQCSRETLIRTIRYIYAKAANATSYGIDVFKWQSLTDKWYGTIKMKKSISSIIDLNESVDVIDIGSNPIAGDPPYKKLLNANLANILGFEPNENALQRLNKKKTINEKYIGKAVYDGSKQEMKICQAEGMTSLLEPDMNLLGYLHGFPDWARVKERLQVQTVRLDDVEEIKNIDYLKIDIQGAELEVFKNATNLLSDCCVIHTEVEFLPIYKDQPLFSEVEIYLREIGFIFHRFIDFRSRTIQPLLVNNDIYGQLNQATWADAVFVKDFTKFNELTTSKLKKTALILNDIYGSFDLALRSLLEVDKKLKKTNYAKKYLEYLR